MRKGKVIMWEEKDEKERGKIHQALVFSTDRIKRAYALCKWEENGAVMHLVFVDLSPETSGLYQTLYWWLIGYGDRMAVEKQRNET